MAMSIWDIVVVKTGQVHCTLGFVSNRAKVNVRPPKKSLHQTKPLVTRMACAGPAPTAFAD
jgi:hypothetical protein